MPSSAIVTKFADDIAIIIKRKSLKSSIKLMEKSLAVIKSNLDNIGLELAPLKTKLLHFNKQGLKPGEIELKIGNVSIKSCKEVLYLGVTFDFESTFQSHRTYVRKKCFQTMNIIKFLRGTWWGADPETLLLLYKSHIRSLIECASFVYFPHKKAQIQSMERMQYAAIRMALGYRISTNWAPI